MFADPVNLESLATIERCIFVLCLDRAIPISFNHQRSVDETSGNLRDDVSLILQMLHGHGSKVNSCNRWFDKTMQVRVILTNSVLRLFYWYATGALSLIPFFTLSYVYKTAVSALSKLKK